MQLTVETLLDGVMRTLREAVLPAVGERFARGQLFAVLDVLQNLRDRVEPKAELAEVEAASAAAALERAAQTLPAPDGPELARALAGAPAEPPVARAAALGLYPNRRVMDAAFSVVRDGRQHVVRASRLAPTDRRETRVGPIFVEVLEPLRALHVRVSDNDFGLSADLAFYARTGAIEEPRFTYRPEGRLLMDVTRLTQFGFWEGYVRIGDEEIALFPDRTPGVRDRSWGVRPVGEAEGGAPGMPPQFFWLWAPIHFDERCTHFAVNEDATGRRWHASGSIAPAGRLDEAAPEPMATVDHRVRWRSGTRRASGADIVLTPHGRTPLTIALEPLLTFQMRGLGYLDPEWGHGQWKGTEMIDGVIWTLADLDPMDPRHLHVQQLCRARCGSAEGLGVLEQLVIGPHAPSGFTSILDPAP